MASRWLYCKAISGVVSLGIVAVLVCSFLVTVAIMGGCDSGRTHQRPSVAIKDRTAPMESRDERVLKAVRTFYQVKGMLVPQRIKIVDRTRQTWLVYAGPESKEAGFEVDPESGTIVKYTPGD